MRRTGEDIGKGRANQPFDRIELIARRIAKRAEARGQRYRDCRRRIRIVRRVETRAADKPVGTGSARQHIVASAAGEHVIRARALEHIVVVRTDQIFDCKQPVALRRAAGCLRAIDRNVDTRAGSRIIDRIDAVAAIEQVRPGPAIEQIVARAAEQRIVAAAAAQLVVAGPAIERVGSDRANQNIIERGADDSFNLAVAVAGRIAACACGPVQVDNHAAGRNRIIDRIEAIAADQQIGLEATDQTVVAGAAIKGFFPVTAAQHIAELRTDQILDVDQCIACGIAAAARLPAKADGYRSQGRGITRGVVARSAVDAVGSSAAIELVIA